MNRNSNELGKVVLAAVAGVGVVLVTPSYAFAITGTDILIPKPAEFFPALIAFLIIWVIMAKLAWPSILGMMEKRQQKIQDDLDAAEKSRVDAAEEKDRYAARIADAEREADEIVAQAKRDAEDERSRILAKAQKDAAVTIAKSREAVDSERRKAMIELSGSVVDLSVEIASKIIGNDLSEEDQRRLAEKYLAEVGTNNEHEA